MSEQGVAEREQRSTDSGPVGQVHEHFKSLAESMREARQQRAIARQQIVVFIAHHHSDYDAAREIADVLEEEGKSTTWEAGTETVRKKVEVFLSEGIRHGDNWRRAIEDALDDADWFILLFPRTQDDWSWCHEEAGFFRGRLHPDGSRLVVLHRRNEPIPDPLKDFQALGIEPLPEGPRKPALPCVESAADEGTAAGGQTPAAPEQTVAETGDVSDDLPQFFKDFYGEPPYAGFPPINPDFARSEKDAFKQMRLHAANRIRVAIGKIVVDSYPARNLVMVRVPLGDIVCEGSATLERATVLGRSREGNFGSTALFSLCGLGDERHDYAWSDFVRKIELQIGNDPDRVDEMRELWRAFLEACHRTAEMKRAYPIAGVFRSPRTSNLYIPSIDRIDIYGTDDAIVHLKLAQHLPRDYAVPAGGSESALHAQVTPLLIVLELANRFRWEILDGFVESESGLWDLLQRLKDMESKSRQQGMDVERLLAAFGFQVSDEAHDMPDESLQQEQDKADRCIKEALNSQGMHRDLAMMLDRWMERRRELEAAVQSRDVQMIRSILDEFTPVTNRFIALLAARLSELMKENVA
jgi:hypothetical protein